MNSEVQHPHLPDGLIWRETDDGVVVVDPASGKVRVLNGVGSTIWQRLAAGDTIADIIAHLTAEYDVSAEVARDDLDAFLTDLRDRNMLV